MELELYKKYRPRKFNDVIGQDTIVKSLKNSVAQRDKKINNSFLFQGKAGTGKTTLAFIFAKALNCENLSEDFEPCNECASCKAIDLNSLPGFEYISMAENGSVDEIRKLVEKSMTCYPLRQSVFICDEIQNVSRAGQDALLTALESENQKTIFILCTTDPKKITDAVKSRSQSRIFNKVDIPTLSKHLIEIAKKENVLKNLNKEQIISSARDAQGSVRNAIRNLETVLSGGTIETSFSNKVLNELVKGNTLEIYSLSNQMNKESQDYVKTLEQIYSDLSIILQIKAGRQNESEFYKDINNKTSGNFILKALEEIGETLKSMSNKVVDGRILFEISLTKLSMLQKKMAKKQEKGGE